MKYRPAHVFVNGYYPRSFPDKIAVIRPRPRSRSRGASDARAERISIWEDAYREEQLTDMDDVLPFGDDDLLNELDTEPVLVVTAYDSSCTKFLNIPFIFRTCSFLNVA